MLSLNSTARSLCCMAVLAMACVPFRTAHAAANADQVAQLQSQLEQSLKAIDQLTARVRELESRMDAVQPGGAPGAAPASPRLLAHPRRPPRPGRPLQVLRTSG